MPSKPHAWHFRASVSKGKLAHWLVQSVIGRGMAEVGDGRFAACGLAQNVYPCFSLSNAASKATRLGSKSIRLTNSQASLAPWSRSMPPSSHSTDSGPW